jgi:hypothetical protein
MRRLPCWAAVAVGLLLGCASPEQPSAPPTDVWRTEFRADPPIAPGQEAYICYAFPIDAGVGLQVGRVAWEPPQGPVRLHHASLYAAAGVPEVGEVPCDPMPERVAALGVYTPGEQPLELPQGVAVALPPGTQRLLVLAHAIRLAEGPAQTTHVTLRAARPPIEHVLNWVDVFGPVPVLFPHEAAMAVGRCRFAQPVHLVTVWPHMHRLGSEFHGTVIRANGQREPLLDLASWSFDHQLIYPVDVQLEPGDAVETRCQWENPTDTAVLPGPRSSDEMCNQGLFLWPFDHARCDP